MKPLFSICVIARNEEKTLPRLVSSLKEFTDLGGEICVLDTGSTDNTEAVARELGCKVSLAGSYFRHRISVLKRFLINLRFVTRGEKAIIKKGDTYFDFAAARNECARMSVNQVVFFYDADEVNVKMDIDAINSFIKQGVSQFEYNFVFAYDQWGNEAVKFVQCKAYNKLIFHWTGIVHELVTPIFSHLNKSKRVFLDENIYKLGHYQNQETGRHSYLTGLAVDCFNLKKADRQSHYLARELMWSGRPKSAIREFERHVKMNRWVQEKAQSIIHIGDCYGVLNDPLKQLQFYSEAFGTDSTRREALIKIAHFYLHNKNYQAAVVYAKGALEVPRNNFYANNLAHYKNEPHEILYQAYGWLGDIAQAKEHLNKALDYQPYNEKYLYDTRFYFEYPANQVDGWMRFKELTWLYEQAKQHQTIVEIGSWKGRSTHALCSGCKGTVFAVDTWQGSDDLRDDTNQLAKTQDVYAQFTENTRQFSNLTVIRKRSLEAAACFEDNSIDMVFIDAGHDYESVRADIEAWFPKCKNLICGHDYVKSWMGVIQAVDEAFGDKIQVTDSIWSADPNYGALKFKDQSLKAEQNTEPSPPKILEQIPRTIYTAWLSDKKELPEKIARCIKSQSVVKGYEHHLFTIDDFELDNIPQYLRLAIEAKQWVKAVDYLRMMCLQEEGGIFLDADVEVLPNANFDQFLSEQMFIGTEPCDMPNGLILGTAIIGAKKHHPLIAAWKDKVDSEFTGNDGLYYESSMDVLNKVAVNFQDQFRHYPPDVFHPYDHKKDALNITPNTITIHHFMRSWVTAQNNTQHLMPGISVVLPHDENPERQQSYEKFKRSFENLRYPGPLQLVEMLGPDTVPVKMEKALPLCKYDIIVYAATDMEFLPDTLFNAGRHIQQFGLVAFNEGPLLLDKGNICTHFMITRSLIAEIGGKIFDTDFHHIGCDNLLYEKARILGKFYYCENAKIYHWHFSKGSMDMDATYKKGWDNVEKDRQTLEKKLKALRDEFIGREL